MFMEYIGNKELLNLPKTAFLASSTIPTDMVLKCYDWAQGSMRDVLSADLAVNWRRMCFISC